ncbi:MAG TPA: flagellar export chaperone FliS [Bacillota bacterium]|nr:flagellar export chaperone FliS [Bacillota bacterium]
MTQDAAGYLQAARRYREMDMLSARPEVLLSRLLARAVSRAELGARAIDAGNWVEVAQSLGSVQAIVAELRESLDPAGGEVAANLDQLYIFCQEELLRGASRKDGDAVRNAARILAELHAAWSQMLERQGGVG